MKRLYILLFIALMTYPSAFASFEEVILIANNSVLETTLSPTSVKRIYLGLKTRWDDKQKVIPVMLKGGETHEFFVEEVLDKTEAKFSIFWKKAVFSGRGLPPKSFATEQELVEYVASVSGAIGYVSRNTKINNVKVLTLE